MESGANEKDYKALLEKVGIEQFRERLSELIRSAESFISNAGYEKDVQCNERIMLSVVLDYYADIERLKEFHKIKNVRTEKIFAYLIAWILRRKPLQFIHYTEIEKDIYVNERFAVYILINERMPFDSGKYVAPKDENKLDAYIDLLLYYFKYRECNPQAIELAIESFKMGMLVKG